MDIEVSGVINEAEKQRDRSIEAVAPELVVKTLNDLEEPLHHEMSSNCAKLVENYENVLPPKECELQGKVPEWLTGTMLRNGPGMFKIGETEYRHWFDGLAYIQRYHFQDGKMYYSARFLEGDTYKANMAAQRIVSSQFGTYKFPDPCKNIFHRYFSYFFEDEPATDNTGVAFVTIGDGVYALTEVPIINRIDLDTLDRLEKVNLDQYLTLNTYTAHQHSDKEGNVFNIGSQFGKDSHYVFATTSNPLKEKSESGHSLEHTRLIGKLPCSDPLAPGYYHSFGMSENYFALLEAPVRISMKKMIVRKLMSYSYRDAFYWDGNLGTNVLIMNKKTGQPLSIKIKSDAFFTFHHANSFEKDGFLVLDYCRMENPGDFSGLSLAAIRKEGFQNDNFGQVPYLHRMIIPLSVSEVSDSAKPGDDLLSKCSFAGKCTAILKDDGSVHVTDRRVCEESFEFPQYNYSQYNMKEYKYVYGTNVLHSKEGNTTGVVKANVQDSTHIVWNKEDETHMCAEPIFVRNPSGTAEDDGVLIVPIMTTKDGDRPFVVILDAKNLEEVARYVIPESRMPLGFHAHFTSR